MNFRSDFWTCFAHRMRAFFVKTEALRPVFVHLVKCASPRCLFGFCFAPCCEQKVEVCHVTMWQFSHWKLARVEVVRNLFDRSLVGLCFEKKCIEHPKFHHSWVLEENVVSKRWCWSFNGVIFPVTGQCISGRCLQNDFKELQVSNFKQTIDFH